MLEWLRTGVLKKNYHKDRVNSLLSKIKIDDSELNWIYVQIVDQLSICDKRMLIKAFGIRIDSTNMELSKEILAYKRSKKNV